MYRSSRHLSQMQTMKHTNFVLEMATCTKISKANRGSGRSSSSHLNPPLQCIVATLTVTYKNLDHNDNESVTKTLLNGRLGRGIAVRRRPEPVGAGLTCSL